MLVNYLVLKNRMSLMNIDCGNVSYVGRQSVETFDVDYVDGATSYLKVLRIFDVQARCDANNHSLMKIFLVNYSGNRK
jgi:hypothetical protein